MSGLQSKTVPSVTRIQALWQSSRMTKDPMGAFYDHMERMGDTYYYYFGGLKKVLVTSNPGLLQHILRDNYDNYQTSKIRVERMAYFLGTGLLTSHWRQERRLLQQGFRPSSLAALAPIMYASLEESLPRFDAAAQKGPVDLCPAILDLTFAMVARSLFRARLTDDEIQLISDAITKIQAFIVRQIVQPYLGPWFRISGELREHEAIRAKGDAVLLQVIRNRRSTPGNGDDLLQMLLDALYGDTGQGMTDAQILNESMVLLVAGHETSSNVLAWTLYLLCRHPEYLRQARDEFDAVVGDGPLEFSHIPQLRLSSHILEEALRLYPPLWMVDRVAVEDDRVMDIEISRGTTIVAFIYGAHHSRRHWTDPENFRPERFDNIDKKTDRGFTYLPFGGGPRGCIGANYAMLQMLMILSVILRKYDFSLNSDAAIDTNAMVILRPRGGIWANIRPHGPQQLS